MRRRRRFNIHDCVPSFEGTSLLGAVEEILALRPVTGVSSETRYPLEEALPCLLGVLRVGFILHPLPEFGAGEAGGSKILGPISIGTHRMSAAVCVRCVFADTLASPARHIWKE